MEIKKSVREIKKYADQGKLVIFIGSGVSRNSGYPSWKDLVRDFDKVISYSKDPSNQKYSSDEMLKIPQYAFSNEAKYYEVLLEQFKLSDETQNPILDSLMSLNPQHIITTNYDNLIELAIERYNPLYTNEKRAFEVIHSDSDLVDVSSSHLLIKMHGDLRAYFPSVTEVFTVPYRYDEETGTFRIATDREDLFALSQISISEQVDMIAYKDDSSEMMAKLVIKCVDANTKLNCGNTMNLQMVGNITTELVEDETVYKIVLANDKEIYADISKFDFDNLPVYDASTGEIVGTYSLKSGDIIRYTVDARDNLTAIEPVYDHTNKVFLGGKANEKEYRYYGGRSPWAIQKFLLYDTDENNYGRFLRYQDGIEDAMKDLEKAYVFQIKNAYVYREGEGKSPDVAEAATGADFVTYVDSKTEYIDIIATQSNMNIGDVYFIYKH